MPSNTLNMTIDETQNIPIIVGNTYSFNIGIQNFNSGQRLYNLGLSFTLPDGMSLSTSTIPQTSSYSNSDNSTTYLWVNLKDLAPMEVSYTFIITVKCNSKFKNNTAIPFGYNFSGIIVSCQTDTMPRGNYDIGNEVITESTAMTFTTIMFNSTISNSSKVLKGAGSSLSLNDYTQVNTSTCKFYNNSVSTSLVNISILLDDGIRYIGNISVSGTDASQFKNPSINTVIINSKLYTQIYYSNINLSINSNATLTFNYAIWNQYNNNQGNFIYHGTMLNMYINMSSANPLITSTSSSSSSFAAMDLIINTSINNSLVDVQSSVTYTYTYEVGQYYNIQNIIVNYFLPDGIQFLSSSPSATIVVNNPTLQGFYLTYNFPLATQNSTKTVTISAKINSYYQYKLDSQSLNLPIVAADVFFADTDISGMLIGPLTLVSDNSNVSSSIQIANITKQFLKAYYIDGTPKSINTLAPGDFAEYLLSYNASTLQAIQKQVYIDDFFPLASDPINNLDYVYKGCSPVSSPQLISPHGVDFSYGDIPGKSLATIDFKVPIAQLGSPSQNINLMKLKGTNTYGYSYSGRSQVSFNIGSPNLQLSKTVNGSNKSTIQANEIYTYTVTITNTNNLGTETDAFDFTLTDTLSSWFSINSGSLKITSPCSYEDAEIEDNTISVYINKLAPGQSLNLIYTVTISSFISPGVNITTTATNTNPYSQIYSPDYSNYQYSNLNKSASVTISSASITLTKTNVSSVSEVGSPITYIITATIPQGTITYGLYLKDTLPSGLQSYVGPAYRNNVIINPTISSNTVTFPVEGTVDARASAQTINYIINCLISNGSKSIGTTTSTQNNTIQCFYQQIQGGSFTSISKTLNITLNHPNLLMNLTVTDKTTSIIYNQTANINTNSIMQFRLSFQNNSIINLVNGTVQIPINSNFLFYSIDTTSLCSATYKTSSKNIIITIPALAPSVSGYVTFTVIPQPNLVSGTSINTQATATSYYNNISTTKVYSGEQSNNISCVFQPGVSLLPDSSTKLDDSTSFIVTKPGDTAVIYNYFRNTGGGYDSFALSIQKVSIPYTLYIDNVQIAYVPANTLYSSTLSQMSNLAPNTNKLIQIDALIPINQPLGSRYDFTVTVTSNTNPFPTKTVLNIDPSF